MSTAVNAITVFFYVTPDNGQCFNPPEVFLWHISLIVLSCTWSLLFGSLDFRKLLQHLQIPLFEEKQINFTISLTGSLIWNVSMTVLTAHILTTGGVETSAPIGYLFSSWLARPLPGAATLLVSLFDYNAFQDNFREIVFVESIYALPAIWLFGTIAMDSTQFSSQASDYLAQDAQYGSGFSMLRGGAAVDFLAWILLLIVLVILVLLLIGEGMSKTLLGKGGRIIWALLALCVLRFLGGALIWVGSTQLYPTNFCPTQLMITRVTMLWTFVPLVDVLWRGFWGIGQQGRRERDD